MRKGRAPVSLPAFYLKWGELAEWTVPDFHLEICDWLPQRGRLAVLKCFRGASKSTILGRYIPHRHRENPNHRFLVMSATDRDASKISADSQFVIERHPWCQGMKNRRRGMWKVHWFSVEDAIDARNPSCAAYGITSNVTSSRADEAIFDDVEVPKTIATPDLREGMRAKISETTHILVPGGSKLYVGTDHCHDSLYVELEAKGADVLKFPLFQQEAVHVVRDDGPPQDKFIFSWRVNFETDLMVVAGSQVLQHGADYQVHGVRDYRGGYVQLASPVIGGTVVEIYDRCTWPARFTPAECKFKREECRTLNEWRSQYQLMAVSLKDSRLNPERLQEYTAEPIIRRVNGEIFLEINGIPMVAVAAVWDCSLGKVTSDASVLSVIFQDSRGFLYWHLAEAFLGDVYEQAGGVAKIVKRLRLPAVTVKQTGIGGFLPTILKGVLQRAGLDCAVLAEAEKGSKNVRILQAFETPLSGLFLYAHSSVKHGAAGMEMKEWDPRVLSQPDDYLDAGAACISQVPVVVGKDPARGAGVAPREEWRRGGGTQEVQVDFGR